MINSFRVFITPKFALKGVVMEMYLVLITLIAVIMQIAKIKIIELVKLICSVYTAYKLYDLFSPVMLFNNSDFNNSDILQSYFRSPRFDLGIILTGLIWLFFYKILIRLPKLYNKRIEDYLDKNFENLDIKSKEKYANIALKSLIASKKSSKYSIMRIFPSPKSKKVKSLENALLESNMNLVILIHIIICMIFLKAFYSLVFLPFAFIGLLIMPVLNPILNHLKNIGLIEINEPIEESNKV